MTTPEPPTPSPAPRTDIYARIRRAAPVLVVLFCAGMLVFVAIIHPFTKPPVAIEVRTPLVASEGDPTAAYVWLHNGGGSDVLLSASTPAAATVVLQQWQTSQPGDGTQTVGHLVTVDHLDVPGFGDLRMQPGGDQLLLSGLVEPLRVGQTIPITLVFERSGTQTVQAEAQTYDTIADRLLPPRLKVSNGN
jgi:copper(I)-binding protein